jgi:hypothetical protein
MVLDITAQSFAFDWLFLSSVSFSYIDIRKKGLTASYITRASLQIRTTYELLWPRSALIHCAQLSLPKVKKCALNTHSHLLPVCILKVSSRGVIHLYKSISGKGFRG